MTAPSFALRSPVRALFQAFRFQDIHHLSSGDVTERLRQRERVTGARGTLACHTCSMGSARPLFNQDSSEKVLASFELNHY